MSDGLHALTLGLDGLGGPDDGAGITKLADWWKEVGPPLRKAAPPRVTLKVSVPARLPAVGVAPAWLTQAMLNLIVNANEAIPKRARG